MVMTMVIMKERRRSIQETRTNMTTTKMISMRALVAMKAKVMSILRRIAMVERRMTMAMKTVMRMIRRRVTKRTWPRLFTQHQSPAECSALHRVATPLARLFHLRRLLPSLAVPHPSLPSLTLRLDRRAT